MGRPRKIKSVKAMEELWEQYKYDCDHQMVLTHDFSAKNSEFVSKELQRSVTYTIEGFCVFIGISRRCFYEYYANDTRFGDIVTRMREECESDARRKFETGQIPSQLSGLWMSRYGYGVKPEAALTGQRENNLLEAIQQSTREEMNTDDLPELQQTADPSDDMVESAEV